MNDPTFVLNIQTSKIGMSLHLILSFLRIIILSNSANGHGEYMRTSKEKNQTSNILKIQKIEKRMNSSRT